jgi:hemolysin activation/secretion protein
MLTNQTNADFNNLRTGATPTYFYSQISLSVAQKLPKSWKVLAKGKAQLAASNLIPSEQFSLGGAQTIRGYDEKAVGGDNALCANLEITTPSIAPIGTWAPKVKDSLAFLGFIDTGYAWYHEEVAGKPESQSLLGIGSGVRYSIASYLTSSIDVGFPIVKVQNDSGDLRVHFNTVISF